MNYEEFKKIYLGELNVLINRLNQEHKDGKQLTLSTNDDHAMIAIEDFTMPNAAPAINIITSFNQSKNHAVNPLNEQYVKAVASKNLTDLLNYLAVCNQQNHILVPDTDNMFQQDLIFLKLINPKMHAHMLKDTPTKPFLDLVMVPYLFVHTNKSDESLANIKITNDIVDLYFKDVDIFELGMKNTPTLFPKRIANMGDVLDDLGFTNDEPLDQELIDMTKTNPLIVVTNQSGISGAHTMLYPDIFAQIAKDLNDDLFIIPSSIHEVLTVPARQYTPSDLLAMLFEGNLVVDYEEILSERIYTYCRATNAIYLI